MYLLHTNPRGEVALVSGVAPRRAFSPSGEPEGFRAVGQWIGTNLAPPLQLGEPLPASAVIGLSAGSVVEYCKALGLLLHAGEGHIRGAELTKYAGVELCRPELTAPCGPRTNSSPDGVVGKDGDLWVPRQVMMELARDVQSERSEARRVTSLPIERTFVYLDISDFSRFKPGQQALVINSLVNVVFDKVLWAPTARGLFRSFEAMLCIGDGYIFVFDAPFKGAYFAAYLAQLIEVLGAHGALPVEFHFRMGVHIGPVYSFWDPGRQGWNYVGDGVNGGNRVLTAVGKEQDDVVFISGQVRKAIEKVQGEFDEAPRFLGLLTNRGRKADKHGNHWRVYEVNHTGVCGKLVPRGYDPKQVEPGWYRPTPPVTAGRLDQEGQTAPA
jgi:class 3 adenylate cyclase